MIMWAFACYVSAFLKSQDLHEYIANIHDEIEK